VVKLFKGSSLFLNSAFWQIEEKTELVFAIDVPVSMKDDFTEIRKNWFPKFKNKTRNRFEILKFLLFLL